MLKSILSSWTVWFGIFQVLSGVFGLLSHQMDSAQAQTLIVTGIGTIGFRFKTTEPIFEK